MRQRRTGFTDGTALFAVCISEKSVAEQLSRDSSAKIHDNMAKIITKYDSITEKIIGCAMKIHNYLGNGFQEVIYQRCMAIEFDQAELNYLREAEIPIIYNGVDVGTRRVDFLVESAVLVELKAISMIDKTHYNQMLNYLRAYRLEIGLLINFGEDSLKFKRFLKNKPSESRN